MNIFSKVDLVSIILLMQAGFLLLGVPVYVTTSYKYGGISARLARITIFFSALAGGAIAAFFMSVNIILSVFTGILVASVFLVILKPH